MQLGSTVHSLRYSSRMSTYQKLICLFHPKINNELIQGICRRGQKFKTTTHKNNIFKEIIYYVSKWSENHHRKYYYRVAILPSFHAN